MKHVTFLLIAIFVLSASSLNAMVNAARKAGQALAKMPVKQLETMSKEQLVQAMQTMRNALTETDKKIDALERVLDETLVEKDIVERDSWKLRQTARALPEHEVTRERNWLGKVYARPTANSDVVRETHDEARARLQKLKGLYEW